MINPLTLVRVFFSSKLESQRYHYSLTPALYTLSLFFFCQGGPCFSTQSPEQIQQQEGGSRGKVSLERVHRLTLTLGLHFSKCVCATTAAPLATSESVYIFGEVFISPKPGVALGEFIQQVHTRAHTDEHTHTYTFCSSSWASHRVTKGRVLSHTHPSQLYTGPMLGLEVRSLRAQTEQK